MPSSEVVEQLAMFMQARDAKQWGIVVDGVAQPTWSSTDEMVREEYRADAGTLLQAVELLGYTASAEPVSFGAEVGERARLERIVGEPIWNASNYPEKAQVHIMGRDISKLRTAVVDALLAAGVRVTAVDPNADERERMAIAICEASEEHQGWEVADERERNAWRASAQGAQAAGFGDVAAERARAWAEGADAQYETSDRLTSDSGRNPYLTVDQPVPTPEPMVTNAFIDFASRPTPEPPHLDPLPMLGADGGRYPWITPDRWMTFAPRPADENGKPYSQDRADYEGSDQ